MHFAQYLLQKKTISKQQNESQNRKESGTSAQRMKNR